MPLFLTELKKEIPDDDPNVLKEEYFSARRDGRSMDLAAIVKAQEAHAMSVKRRESENQAHSVPLDVLEGTQLYLIEWMSQYRQILTKPPKAPAVTHNIQLPVACVHLIAEIQCVVARLRDANQKSDGGRVHVQALRKENPSHVLILKTLTATVNDLILLIKKILERAASDGKAQKVFEALVMSGFTDYLLLYVSTPVCNQQAAAKLGGFLDLISCTQARGSSSKRSKEESTSQ
ncbi:hypothetical protein [Eleftheria terrae]|uniref:hypothetical protein n=1 Tax=Eleftheria terrae TaxID=1597781 RepID=UPI00263B7E9E|nr:hypothetical protein [Eleftheria terrae]WKB54377.1 hypothetical protein N7L95_08320 [Eleftheria terrae]